MAYLYTDADGDEAVKFEIGKWDSFWGYICPKCGVAIGSPGRAMEHENGPCNGERPTNEEGKKLIWSG